MKGSNIMSQNITRVAVPSKFPGGLESNRSEHFGRCDLFTVIDVAENKIIKVEVIENPPHIEQGCLRPVNLLASHKVEAILVGGIGGRPLSGFNSVGIEVYFGVGDTVKEAIEAFLNGELRKVTLEDTCGGHCKSQKDAQN